MGLLDPERQQITVLDAMALYRWCMCVKYRQAKISTVAAMALLGHVEYTPGIQGVFVAERLETAETVWNRASYAYEHQPPETRIPLKAGTSASKRELRFVHNGAVRVITGGGHAPAIGNSPDRIVVTEYPDVPDHDNFNQHFFPTVNKRPNARVFFEHTPGLADTIPHTMWLNALDGKGRFHPIFLKWWKDPSIVPINEDGSRRDCADLVPTNEELRIVEKLPSITKAHLMFRRLSLDTEFHGDTLLFQHKYPFDPYDGWVYSTNPAIPQDAVQHLLQKSVKVADGVEHIYEGPDDDDECPILITADPAGFGEKGDPSALTVWNAWDHREIACWAGREDPGMFAQRIRRLQKFYGEHRVTVAVESNKGECVQALLGLDTPNMYMTSENHPGYYATEESNDAGRVAMVDQLRRQTTTIRTRATLHQILQWDGKGRKKRTKTAEGTHHFDRAVTVRIAAHLFRIHGFGSRPATQVRTRGMTWKQVEALFKKKPKRHLGIPTG